MCIFWEAGSAEWRVIIRKGQGWVSGEKRRESNWELVAKTGGGERGPCSGIYTSSEGCVNFSLLIL